MNTENSNNNQNMSEEYSSEYKAGYMAACTSCAEEISKIQHKLRTHNPAISTESFYKTFPTKESFVKVFCGMLNNWDKLLPDQQTAWKTAVGIMVDKWGKYKTDPNQSIDNMPTMPHPETLSESQLQAWNEFSSDVQ